MERPDILIDNYGRQITYLRVSVTDRCNLRCIYCMPREGIPLLPREKILSYEEIIKVIKVAFRLGITNFRITGGEPLVRSGIVNFLENVLKTAGVKPAPAKAGSGGSVSLTTNGLLLKQYTPQLKKLKLGGINISLNSLSEDNFQRLTGVKGLQIVRNGIEALLKEGFNNLKINTVVIRGFNDMEIIDFARLTIDRPVTVRFIEYMPCGIWPNQPVHRVVSAEEIINRLKVLGEILPVNKPIGYGPARYYQISGAQGIIGFITAVSQPFCADCNRLRLTADGYLKSCLLSPDTIDLKPILRSGSDSSGMLKNAFIQAAALKPKSHQKEILAPMSRIGG